MASTAVSTPTTDYVALAAETARKVENTEFREYLLSRLDVMIEFTVQYFQHMGQGDLLLSMQAPCMLTLRRLSQDYCTQSGQNWLDFISSDAFMQGGAAMAAHLGGIHLDRVMNSVKLRASH